MNKDLTWQAAEAISKDTFDKTITLGNTFAQCAIIVNGYGLRALDLRQHVP